MSDRIVALSGCPVVVSNILVCLSFCKRDADLLIENLRWQQELGSARRFECGLVYDETIQFAKVDAVMRLTSPLFVNVHDFKYPKPPYQRWPNAPNYAFQHTARKMAEHGRPWFWMEPDCIPLKSGWMERLEQEYDQSGKPFMGPVVPNMGHINGVAIYPANTPDILKKGMQCTNSAWDSVSKQEMIPYAHDASHLMQHAWGLVNGRFTPQHGDPPVFKSKDLLSQLLPTAVLFHRCKGTSLIERLREVRRES